MARRKKSMIALPVIIALVLIMIAMVGIIAYWYVNGNKLRLPGEWYREIDLTAQVQDEIEKYLDTATMGEEINVSKYLDEIIVESHLSVGEDGTIVESIDEMSYVEAKKKANDALEETVSDLIKLRIESNFIETDKKSRDLVKETFDMELANYLKEYGPKLMPTMEEMNGEYGMKAEYVADRETMTITSEEELLCEYAVAGQMLVIDYPEGAVVYHSLSAANEKEGAKDE